MKSTSSKALLIAIVAIPGGCADPLSTVAQLGAKVAGKVVDGAETRKLGERLVGRPAGAADSALGPRVDTLCDINGPRVWLVYRVPLDVLNRRRFYAEVLGGRIVDLKMIEKNGDATDLPLELLYYEKARHKTPPACQAALKLGPPLMTLRSAITGRLSQIYDARLIREWPKPHYCVVEFAPGLGCDKVSLVETQAGAEG